MGWVECGVDGHGKTSCMSNVFIATRLAVATRSPDTTLPPDRRVHETAIYSPALLGSSSIDGQAQKRRRMGVLPHAIPRVIVCSTSSPMWPCILALG